MLPFVNSCKFWLEMLELFSVAFVEFEAESLMIAISCWVDWDSISRCPGTFILFVVFELLNWAETNWIDIQNKLASISTKPRWILWLVILFCTPRHRLLTFISTNSSYPSFHKNGRGFCIGLNFHTWKSEPIRVALLNKLRLPFNLNGSPHGR